MRKICISFLGTNDYIRCNYVFDCGHSVKNVQYIQEALYQHICKDWSCNDVFYVFLTKDAAERNWDDHERFNKSSQDKHCDSSLGGLKTALLQYPAGPTVYPVTDIPEGYTEIDIWNLFQQLVSKVKEKDEIHLDITHGFRSLPMLAMVLLNYLKVTHSIRIGGIYYGAFEKLGPAHKIRSEMPISERNAPVLELSSFHTLQEWSNGADVFMNYGISEKLERGIESWANPIKRETKGKDAVAKSLGELSKAIHEIYPAIATNRGKDIYQGKIFESLKNSIHNLKKHTNTENLRALEPLLELINNKIASFSSSNEVKNGFHAVQWCIDHGMVQQGITILQETLLSYAILFIDQEKIYEREFRETLSDKIGLMAQKKQRTNMNIDEPSEIFLHNNAWLIKAYGDLILIRNDVNHCGLRPDTTNPTKMKTALERVYSEAIKKIP
ncbi:TIGR02221 family CRISPR-associated protein [Spirochaeta dissipatitropha]